MASDRFRRRDIRWSLWLVAAVLVVTRPFYLGFLMWHATLFALALFIVPGITGAIFIGPSLAVLHNRVGAEMRPLASALFLLVVNFIGLGIGPLMVGATSEYIFAAYASDALRYSLIATQIVALWAALHYYLAGSGLRAEGDQPGLSQSPHSVPRALGD